MEQRTDLIERSRAWRKENLIESSDDGTFAETLADFALSLNPWVETSVRLPSESGEYLMRRKIDNVQGQYCEAIMLLENDARVTDPDIAKSFANYYSHWQRIVPPAPPTPVQGGE